MSLDEKSGKELYGSKSETLRSGVKRVVRNYMAQSQRLCAAGEPINKK